MLKYFAKAENSAQDVGAEYEHARTLIDKSNLDYANAMSDRERGLEMLAMLGCVLPDRELEYLGIDRDSHYAQSAAVTKE